MDVHLKNDGLIKCGFTYNRFVNKLHVFVLGNKQGVWSLSERSHWSIWLDPICMGLEKISKGPISIQCFKYYPILVRI